MIPDLSSQRHWNIEFDAMVLEAFGGDQAKAAPHSYSQALTTYGHDIDTMVAEFGWSRDDAIAVQLLLNRRECLARALRERDPCYSASTYFICDFLAEQAAKLPFTPGVQEDLVYGNLHGHMGLATVDPAWEGLQTPDATGFCGFSSSGLAGMSCLPASFLR